MLKFIKFSEIAYLVIAIISTLEVVLYWNKQRDKAYMFLAFGVVSIAMYFFRRYYRKRLEQRHKK